MKTNKQNYMELRYMNYKKKYLKYKSLYLNIKYNNENNPLTQEGGKKLFQKQEILYIVATISDPKLKKVTKEITYTILNKNKPYRDPHITLFNLLINTENPNSKIFEDENFYNQIPTIYAEMNKDPLILESIPFPRDYSFPGFKPKYFLKNYKPLDESKIIKLRKRIFKLIEDRLGKPRIKDYINNKSRYYVYSYQGMELFAESRYYDIWKPHINFLNDFDIQKHNPMLYEDIIKHRSSVEKVDVLVDKIKHLPLEIYEYINMGTQMRNITYALDHILQKKFKP